MPKGGFNHKSDSSYIGQGKQEAETTGGTPDYFNQSNGPDMKGKSHTPQAGGGDHHNHQSGVKPS